MSSLGSAPLLFGVLVAVAAGLGLLLSPILGIAVAGLGATLAVAVAQTESRRALATRRSSEQAVEPLGWAFPALMDLARDGLLLLDARRTVVFANPAACTLLGRERAEILGRPLIRAAWSSELSALVSAGDGVSREVALDAGRTMRARASRWPDDPSITLLVLNEVSDSLRADRSRTELVANLSHELRTPIAAARALAETLDGGVEDEPRRERYQRQLLAEIDRLGAIVERTLRLSRIEAGAEPLDLAPQPPEQLLQAALQRLAPLAETRGVALQLAASAALPEVLADFDRTVEVLALLLDNAVKFSPPGEPVLASASLLPPGFVTFEVRDRGPGILPAERERVFERLYTGDRSRTGRPDEPAGFGLGLAIARHLVVRMGGRIWIADLEGPGAAFRFTLPFAPEQAPA